MIQSFIILLTQYKIGNGAFDVALAATEQQPQSLLLVKIIIEFRLSGIKYQSNFAPTTHLDALVNVDDRADGVADDEDNDDGEEHHGNL